MLQIPKHSWRQVGGDMSPGEVRVVAVNAAGDRAKIRRLKGAELAAALEADGYPELIPAPSPFKVSA